MNIKHIALTVIVALGAASMVMADDAVAPAKIDPAKKPAAAPAAAPAKQDAAAPAAAPAKQDAAAPAAVPAKQDAAAPAAVPAKDDAAAPAADPAAAPAKGKKKPAPAPAPARRPQRGPVVNPPAGRWDPLVGRGIQPLGSTYPINPQPAPYPGYINVWVHDVVINWMFDGRVGATVPVYYHQYRLVTAHWDRYLGGYWYWDANGVYRQVQ